MQWHFIIVAFRGGDACRSVSLASEDFLLMHHLYSENFLLLFCFDCVCYSHRTIISKFRRERQLL